MKFYSNIPLHNYPLLAAYCGGQADESSAIDQRMWRDQKPMLPADVTPEQAEAAEAELAGLTESEAWYAGYDAVIEMGPEASIDYLPPKYQLAWDISGRYF